MQRASKHHGTTNKLTRNGKTIEGVGTFYSVNQAKRFMLNGQRYRSFRQKEDKE